MAEMKKHLSLSRSSIDSGRSSDEPPLSLPQVKLSKECKSPMDRPIPPVDPQSFNDEGEIVVEGNVLQSVKVKYC